jgi:DNA-binding GntR family transcriptional regulator
LVQEEIIPASTSSEDRTSVAEDGYQRIRRDIIRCELEPGWITSKPQLAERYEISTGALLRVLERFVHEGLIEALPREGYRVTPITIEMAEDRIAARLAVEPAIASQAAGRMSEDEIKALDSVCRSIEGLRADAELDQVIKLNRDFHLLIAGSIGSQKLVSMVGSLLDEGDRLWHFLRRSYDVQQTKSTHRAMVDAIRSRDGRGAELAMTADIESARAMCRESLLLSPSIRAVSLTRLPV